MAKRTIGGLGRGLDSILPDNTVQETSGSTMVPLSMIQPRKDQPRKTFRLEELQALADSISTHGMINPITVRVADGGFYEIIAGERRWRAAKMAGLGEVPVVLLAADDRKAAELSIIENVQRADLDPIEEAEAYKKLQNEFKLTQEQIAAAVGKSRSAIANSLRLLDLPAEVRAMLTSGQISEGHAKVLLGCIYEDDLINAAHRVDEKKLSVRQTEALVKQLNLMSERAQAEETEEEAPVKVNYTRVLETKASKLLGRKVAIGGRGKTKRLELFYEDREDLEGILKQLCGDKIFEDDLS